MSKLVDYKNKLVSIVHNINIIKKYISHKEVLEHFELTFGRVKLN